MITQEQYDQIRSDLSNITDVLRDQARDLRQLAGRVTAIDNQLRLHSTPNTITLAQYAEISEAIDALALIAKDVKERGSQNGSNRNDNR